jgi:hypothetical protein
MERKSKSTLISESEYLQPKAARTKSAVWREQRAKLDEKETKRSFLHDHPYSQLQDLNLKHKIKFAKLMFKKHIKVAWITGKLTNNIRKPF